jgi:uncharacterized repeat protein (TIGR01451 family)
MFRRVLIAVALALCIALVAFGTARVAAVGPTINLEPFATEFNNPIGIDFYEPAVGLGRLIMTVNYYPTCPGCPVPPVGLHNIDLVSMDGTHEQFSNLAGEPDELKIATVRASSCTGGFPVGTAFVGTGGEGEASITRIDPAGGLTQPWVALPTDEPVVRGSLYQDRHCVFGGDLIVVTGNPQDPPTDRPSNFAGSVWRINSFGVATKIVSLGKHLEGVITLPDDPATWGPLAGRIVVGDEDFVFTPDLFQHNGPHGKLFGIKSATDIITVGATADPQYPAFPHFTTNVPIHPEDLDIINRPRPGISGDGDLYAVDFGNAQVLRAPASDFADKCGELLVSHEFPDDDAPAGFSTLKWNGTSYVVTPLANLGSAVVGHFEHVSFQGGTDCAPPNPNLTIKKVAAKHVIVPGELATFGIVVTNEGPGPATNVTVTDVLPEGLTWSSDQPSNCSIGAGKLTCLVTSLGEGASFTVNISAPTEGVTIPDDAPMCNSGKQCRLIDNVASVAATNEDTTRLDDNESGDTIQLCPPDEPQIHKKKRKIHYHDDGCDLRDKKNRDEHDRLPKKHKFERKVHYHDDGCDLRDPKNRQAHKRLPKKHTIERKVHHHGDQCDLDDPGNKAAHDRLPPPQPVRGKPVTSAKRR